MLHKLDTEKTENTTYQIGIHFKHKSLCEEKKSVRCGKNKLQNFNKIMKSRESIHRTLILSASVSHYSTTGWVHYNLQQNLSHFFNFERYNLIGQVLPMYQ